MISGHHSSLLPVLLSLLQAFISPGLQHQGGCNLKISFKEDASFALQAAGLTLESAPLRLFGHGRWQNASTLRRTAVQQYQGQDELGLFECINVSWATTADPQVISFHTSMKSYAPSCAVVFSQEVPQGIANTNASNPVLPPDIYKLNPGKYPPILNFPSLRSDKLETLGFLLWSGVMAKAVHGQNVTEHLAGLESAGPVALFDNSKTTLVISPMDNFKNSVHFYDASGRSYDLGVSSEVDSLPASFVHRTLVLADVGITRAMDRFGSLIRRAHGTTRAFLNSDPVVNYLSYWTDNGAYYYGDQWHEAGGGGETCGETSMLQVAEGLSKQDLLQAVRIWQLDDWWYPGHPAVYVHCVEDWVLGRGFHRNLSSLHEALDKPWLLYVPFFCKENAYSHRYRFIPGSHGATEFAVPHPEDASAFYQMLFDYGIANGMRSFEHDFLNFNFQAVPYLRRTFGASRQWLQAMDAAAAERNVPIQMCMALPSDLMTSLDFRSTTNYRASDDYASPINFDIGASSLLAHALQLRPSKDSFWSMRPASSRATGRPWGPHDNPGSNCELNLLIACLSTGPVALADKAGETNRTLLMRAMRPDGLLLQPDKPATAIDAVYMQELPPRRLPPPALVWATYARIRRPSSQDYFWHYALSIDLSQPWQLQPDDFFPALDLSQRWVVKRWHKDHHPNFCVNGSDAFGSGCLLAEIRSAQDFPHIADDRGVMVQNDTHQFDLWQFSPVEENGWVFLGEVEKYVSVSSKRFSAVQASPAGLVVIMSGVKGETVRLTALRPSSSGWIILEKAVELKDTEASVTFGMGAATSWAEEVQI